MPELDMTRFIAALTALGTILGPERYAEAIAGMNRALDELGYP
jgi:hypothetical protein